MAPDDMLNTPKRSAFEAAVPATESGRPLRRRGVLCDAALMESVARGIAYRVSMKVAQASASALDVRCRA